MTAVRRRPTNNNLPRPVAHGALPPVALDAMGEPRAAPAPADIYKSRDARRNP